MAVSLTASLLAFAIGAPLGSALSVYRFPGRSALIVIANALLGLPPVVVGLVVYLLLSRSGPLGSFGILFTPTAMVIAQSILVVPLVAALARRLLLNAVREGGDQLRSLGAGRMQAALLMLLHERFGVLRSEER